MSSEDSYIEEFIRSDFYSQQKYGRNSSCTDCFKSYEEDRKLARDLLDHEKKNQELIELEKQKIREKCQDDEKYETTNILVLCQREKGDILYTGFSYKNINDIVYKPINMFLNPEEKCNLNIEYMTTGVDHKDDKMTHNLFFGFHPRNEEFIEFVKNHIKYYSYIIFGACPPVDFCRKNALANIKTLNNLLKNNGKILFPWLRKNTDYKNWDPCFAYKNLFFETITDDPFLILKKKYNFLYNITDIDIGEEFSIYKPVNVLYSYNMKTCKNTTSKTRKARKSKTRKARKSKTRKNTTSKSKTRKNTTSKRNTV